MYVATSDSDLEGFNDDVTMDEFVQTIYKYDMYVILYHWKTLAHVSDDGIPYVAIQHMYWLSSPERAGSWPAGHIDAHVAGESFPRPRDNGSWTGGGLTSDPD